MCHRLPSALFDAFRLRILQWDHKIYSVCACVTQRDRHFFAIGFYFCLCYDIVRFRWKSLRYFVSPKIYVMVFLGNIIAICMTVCL